MPTYDYRCAACGHEFEEFQSITADPLKTCPACKKRKLQRLLGTGGGIIFKGSGFYQTDYRSASYKKAADADKPKTATEKSGGDGAKKSDGKSGGAGKKKDTSASKVA
jgi:putative FmdB family regulatory protein